MRNDDYTYVEIYTICLIDWRDLIPCFIKGIRQRVLWYSLKQIKSWLKMDILI